MHADMRGLIDLHVHTNASDGSESIDAVIEKAMKISLKYIAITDHNTVAGLKSYDKEFNDSRISIIPGVELTCGYFPEIHILGYYIDVNNPMLLNLLKSYDEARLYRSMNFLRNLRKDYPQIRIGDIKKAYSNYSTDSVIRYMLDIGIVLDKEEAIERFFSEGSKYYVEPIIIEPQEGIEVIKACGGISSIAHLCRIKPIHSLDEFVYKMKLLGIDAIEVYHSEYTPLQVEEYKKLAQKYDLLLTGGSDYHGNKKSFQLGSQYAIPEEIVERMKERIGVQ